MTPVELTIDRDLDESVRPAALRMASARDAGRVVRAHADDVVARCAERGGRRCRTARDRHAHSRRRELHRAWALVLEPGERDGHRASSRACYAARRLAVVLCP